MQPDFAAAAALRQKLIAEWYAPASATWPDIALAPSLERFEELTRVEVVDGVPRLAPELYAPAWAVATFEGLVNRAGLDGYAVAEFVEWATESPERAGEIAAAARNAEHPDVGALRALFRRWLETP